MGFFKSAKNKIAPAPTSEVNKPTPQVNNFMVNDSHYVFLKGDGLNYANGKTDIPLSIPISHFFSNEKQAFEAARAKYPKEAVSIFKAELSANQIERATKTQGGATMVTLDLMAKTQTVKGFSKTDTVFNQGQVYTPIHLQFGISLSPRNK